MTDYPDPKGPGTCPPELSLLAEPAGAPESDNHSGAGSRTKESPALLRASKWLD